MLGRSMAALPIRILAPMALLGLTALPAAAHAQTTAVAPFSGRRSGAMQRLVERALRDQTDVASRGSVRRAARSAGISGLDMAGVPDLASEVGADIVVQGETGGSRRRPRVVLVFRADDGTELARGEVDYRPGRRGRRRFDSDVEGLYQTAAAALEAHRAPPPEPDPEPIEVPIEEPEPEAPPAEVPQDGLALFTGLLGLSIRTRDASIDLADGGRRRYEVGSGVYPELLVRLEARPFANDAHLGRGLFVRGAFAHSVGLSSESGAGAVSTNFLRFALDAGWLAPLGDSFELGIAFGGGLDGYYLGTNDILPSAEYGYLRPGVRARFRVAQETFVIEADLGYRAVLGVGALRPAFGLQGDAHGVDVGVGIGGNLHLAAELGFSWGVRFDWVGYFMSFGSAPGDANDALATGGVDEGVRFTLLAGWSFR